MNTTSPQQPQMREEKSDVKVHIPVLLQEVLEILDPKVGELCIDATFGQGGHSEKILERVGPRGKLIVIDWDWNALKYVPRADNVIPLNDNFACLADVIESLALPKADGLLLDLGLSSKQLDDSGRGFTFRKAEPLHMTYDPAGIPVKDILRAMNENDLARTIFELSDERYAPQIARAIKERERFGAIETSQELAEIIRSAVPRNYEKGRIDPATRTFMALRILANRELDNLQKVLEHLPRIMKHGGRVAIISFHSLEDRIVKQYFQRYVKEGKAKLLTKKPIVARDEEIRSNPRARSAKLRGLLIK